MAEIKDLREPVMGEAKQALSKGSEVLKESKVLAKRGIDFAPAHLGFKSEASDGNDALAAASGGPGASRIQTGEPQMANPNNLLRAQEGVNECAEQLDGVAEKDEDIDEILAKMNEQKSLVKIEMMERIAQVSRVLPPADNNAASRGVFKSTDLKRKKVVFP